MFDELERRPAVPLTLLALGALCALGPACGARNASAVEEHTDGGGGGADALPFGTCMQDSDCASMPWPRIKESISGYYCRLSPGCRRPGTCQAVSQWVCHGSWGPACDCDGKPYKGSCGPSAVGVSLAYPGECGPPLCFKLHVEYLAAVEEAKRCCPDCGTSTCTGRIAQSLGCKCDVAVNAANATALQRAHSIAGASAAAGCSFSARCSFWNYGPNPEPCVSPQDRCHGSGSTGTCL